MKRGQRLDIHVSQSALQYMMMAKGVYYQRSYCLFKMFFRQSTQYEVAAGQYQIIAEGLRALVLEIDKRASLTADPHNIHVRNLTLSPLGLSNTAIALPPVELSGIRPRRLSRASSSYHSLVSA